MRVTWIAAALIMAAFSAGVARAQEGTADDELRRARAQLEAAAREVARLSAPTMDYLRELGPAGRRAVLGINIEDAEGGVRVVGVTPGFGADEAGIEADDVIVAIDGFELAADESPSRLLVAQMQNVEPDETVILTIRRDGSESDMEVEARRPLARGYAAMFRGGPGEAQRGVPFFFNRPLGRWADMELVELTPELGAYFGTEAGVLVVRAPRDESLQLRDGDVILAIGGRTPMGTGHAMRILASFEPGEELELTIMRRQSEQTLAIEIPQDESGG